MSSKKIPKELKGYTTQEFLGKGSFANVFDCRKNGRKYAMKRINSEQLKGSLNNFLKAYNERNK